VDLFARRYGMALGVRMTETGKLGNLETGRRLRLWGKYLLRTMCRDCWMMLQTHIFSQTVAPLQKIILSGYKHLVVDLYIFQQMLVKSGQVVG
jgi:hypothetical protein